MKYVSIAAAVSLLWQTPLQAAEDHQSGNIINMTSTAAGLMIMLDSGIPNHCRGTPYGWLLIKEENKAMTAVALAMWAAGKKGATIYTAPVIAGNYCTVTQLDPYE